MFRELAARSLATVDMPLVMRVLAQIAEHDRYQASLGINAAAEALADIAHATGLKTVRIDRFAADGAPRWWTFKAPTAWTPTTARLQAVIADRTLFELDHERQPFSIATYSAPTAADGLSAPFVILRPDTPAASLAGAVVLVSRDLFRGADLVSRLVAAGAAGFVTDGPCCDAWPGEEQPGRIELDAQTPLFGFSVTTARLAELRAHVDHGASARVQIAIDRRATMPVVHAVLEGDLDAEVLLTAHLCHPRPGANDNASGVAAVLGVADAHIRARQRGLIKSTGSLRFQWGPEFLGTVALLHASLERGTHRLPSSVINLDMVGEDQTLCGGPFVVERSPDTIASRLNAVSEGIVGAIFAETVEHPGVWRSAPFLGYSDHAMFVDPKIARPAVQLCHYPDRFNHSAADTLDKVSIVEMRRATAAAAAIAQVMASGDAELGPRLEGGGENRRRDEGRKIQAASASGATSIEAPASAPVLTADWPGPLNLRAMTEALTAQTRNRLLTAIRTEKLNLALLFNFAIRADGRQTRTTVVQAVSDAMRRPIDLAQANELINCLVESGWISET